MYNRKCQYLSHNSNNLRISAILLNFKNNYLPNSAIYNQNRIFIGVLKALLTKNMVISLKYIMQESSLTL